MAIFDPKYGSGAKPYTPKLPASGSYSGFGGSGLPGQGGTLLSQGASGSGGSGGSGGGSGFGGEITSPWQQQLLANYAAASQPTPYQGDWRQGVAQAMTLGNRDYEGDLRRFAGEDVEKQITASDNQLGALGMRELAMRPDVIADRAKARTDASTRAAIDAQGMKQSALQTMQGVLAGASNAEMARISQMIQAAESGSGQYNQFQQMAIPLQQQAGAASVPSQDSQNAARIAAMNESNAAYRASEQRRLQAWANRPGVYTPQRF